MARLTRDFSGKKSAPAGRRSRLPAYGVEVLRRREAGERIGLLLLAVDDWHGGWYFQEKPNVARIVAPEDFDISTGDLTIVVGLDVLVCGDCDHARFNQAIGAAFRSGAASVWGEFDGGITRLEHWRQAPGYIAADKPVPSERFGAALTSNRDVQILLQEGFYGMAAFDPVRQSLLASAGL